MNKRLIFSFLIISLVFVSACTSGLQQQEKETSLDEVADVKLEGSFVDWREAELTDVLTGGKFKISDFKGKKVLVESFAVWCPTCLKQQQKIKELKDQDDSVIHISLDTDPNEDEAIVKEHANRNNLDWIFAVSPVDVTRSLINEFGLSFVNAPSAPVALICEDQSARKLPSGVKSADVLKEEIEKGC